MKTFLGILFLSSVSFPQYFNDLRGLEDANSNTHLFYRIYSETGDSSYDNSIYHFDLTANSDTLFLRDFKQESSAAIINDYDFLSNNPAGFIYSVTEINSDTVTKIINSNGDILFSHDGIGGNIEISRQNINKFVVNINNTAFLTTDAGLTWNQISFGNVGSMSPFNDSIMFSLRNDSLYKTFNNGTNFFLTSYYVYKDFTNNYFYDKNGTHIYRLGIYKEEYLPLDRYALFISSNAGDPYSWNFRDPPEWYSNNFLMSIAADKNNPGKIYAAQGRKIFLSTNSGSSFTSVAELPAGVNSIYLSGNKIYSAAMLNIYSLQDTNITPVKTINLDASVYDYYPLREGLKWIYHVYTIEQWGFPWIITEYDYSREVIGDTLLQDGFNYFIIEEKKPYGTYKVFERIDSLTGIVYDYDEGSTVALSLMPGDEANTSWGSIYYLQKDFYEKWGLQRPVKEFQLSSFYYQTYHLIKDIGLDSIGLGFDFGWGSISLKGMIKDGIVYGDTTVLDVNDNTRNPNSFALYQNYPNPFNSSCVIKYSVARRSMVNIKIFNALGEEIKILLNEEKPEGTYSVNFNASALSSGIYFYRINAGEFTETKKMILMK